MAAPKLSNQDRKDLDKFTKYLVYKCIQIIVQSRLGEKTWTQSKAFSSGSDWFNLAIRDIPEVLAETKKVFGGGLGLGQHVCVEISLKTAEGETMILETWWITMTEQTDSTARVSYTVYNRMAVMLKSLFCVSRVTPAYRLSRRQGPETFVVCYRIYLGDPQYGCLGEGHKINNVGTVPTPAGTITLSVAYRTKMLISPHQSTRDFAADLKDDHFKSDVTSPRRINPAKPCHTAFKERGNLENGLSGESQSETCAMFFLDSPTDPSSAANNNPQAYSASPPSHLRPTTPKKTAVPIENGRVEETKHESSEEKPLSVSGGQKMGAFAPRRRTDTTANMDNDDIPFLNLLHSPTEPADPNANKNESTESSGLKTENAVSGTDGEEATQSSCSPCSSKSATSQASGQEDFVMVELKMPFAGQDGNSDLGRFYRECQGAPQLTMFEDTCSVQETLNSITDQLAVFESHTKDFDDFINSLEIADIE